MLILYVPKTAGLRPKHDRGLGRVIVATGTATSGTVTSEELEAGRRPISVTEFELLKAGLGPELNAARAEIGRGPMPLPDNADSSTDHHVRPMDTGNSLL